MMIDDEFLVVRNQSINPISFFVLFCDIYILEPSWILCFYKQS